MKISLITKLSILFILCKLVIFFGRMAILLNQSTNKLLINLAVKFGLIFLFNNQSVLQAVNELPFSYLN